MWMPPFSLGRHWTETCDCSCILLSSLFCSSPLIPISYLKLSTLKQNLGFLQVTYKLKDNPKNDLGPVFSYLLPLILSHCCYWRILYYTLSNALSKRLRNANKWSFLLTHICLDFYLHYSIPMVFLLRTGVAKTLISSESVSLFFLGSFFQVTLYKFKS